MQVKKLLINGLARIKNRTISISDYHDPADKSFICMLSDIGNLLTKDKLLFNKYKLVNNPLLEITLQLKVIDKDFAFWCSLDQAIFDESVIDFQNLELVNNGMYFPRSTNRVAAMVRANTFLDKFKQFCSSSKLTIGPNSFNKICPSDVDKFPISISMLEKWVPS